MTLLTKYDIASIWRDVKDVVPEAVLIHHSAAVVWCTLVDTKECIIGVPESFYKELHAFELSYNGKSVKEYLGALLMPYSKDSITVEQVDMSGVDYIINVQCLLQLEDTLRTSGSMVDTMVADGISSRLATFDDERE